MSSSDLEQQETPESKSNGISRRDVIKRGLVVGGATYVVPAVVSMVSPLGAFAATPTPTAGAGVNLIPCTVALQPVATAPVLVGVTGTVIGVIQPIQSQSQSQSQSATATATASSTIAVRVTLNNLPRATASVTAADHQDDDDGHDDDVIVIVFDRNGNEIPGLGRRHRRGFDGTLTIDVQGAANASAEAATVQVQTQKQLQVGTTIIPVGTVVFQAVVVPCVIPIGVVLPVGTVTRTVTQTQTVTRTQTAMLPDCRVTLVPVTTIPGLVGVGTVVAQGQSQSQSQSATASATASSNFDVTITITGLGRRFIGRGIFVRELLECLATLNAEQVDAFIALRDALQAAGIDIQDLEAADLFALFRLVLTPAQITAILAIGGDFTTGNLAGLLGTVGTPAVFLTEAQITAILALRANERGQIGEGQLAGLGFNAALITAIRAAVAVNRQQTNARLAERLRLIVVTPAVLATTGLTPAQVALLVRLGRAAVRAFLNLAAGIRATLATLTLEQISCLLELTDNQLTALGTLTTAQLAALVNLRGARLRVVLRLLNGGTQVGDADGDAEVNENGDITIRVTGSANAAANAVGVQVQTQEQDQGIFQVLGVPAGTVLFTAVVNTPCTLR